MSLNIMCSVSGQHLAQRRACAQPTVTATLSIVFWGLPVAACLLTQALFCSDLTNTKCYLLHCFSLIIEEPINKIRMCIYRKVETLEVKWMFWRERLTTLLPGADSSLKIPCFSPFFPPLITHEAVWKPFEHHDIVDNSCLTHIHFQPLNGAAVSVSIPDMLSFVLCPQKNMLSCHTQTNFQHIQE